MNENFYMLISQVFWCTVRAQTCGKILLIPEHLKKTPIDEIENLFLYFLFKCLKNWAKWKRGKLH